MPTRLLTGIRRGAEGQPLVGVDVTFTVKPTQYKPDAHYTGSVTVTTDSAGVFSLNLVTDIVYEVDLRRVRTPDVSYKTGDVFNIVVPQGEGPAFLEIIRGTGGVRPDEPDTRALIEDVVENYLAEHGSIVPHTHPIAQVDELDDALAGKADIASLADVATSGDYSDLDGVPAAFPPLPHDHNDAYTPLAHATDANNPHGVTAGQTGAYTTAETDSLLSAKADTATLANIATTGSYGDLEDVPDTFPAAPHNHDGVYVKPESLANVATSGDYADLANAPAQFDGDYGSLTNTPTIPDPADFATASQGAKADTAVQPGDLHSVATSGDYGDLANTPTIPDAQVPADWTASTGVERILNKPTLGTAAGADADDFAAASHGHGWDDVTGKPSTFPPAAHGHAIGDVTSLQSTLDGKAASSHTHTIANVTSLQAALDGKAATDHNHDARYVQPGQLGSAALADTADFATAGQGAKADTAVQPVQLHQVATSGDYADLEGKPVLFDGDYDSLTNTPSIPDPADFASAAQGAKADTAVQPSDLATVAVSGSYNDLSDKPSGDSGNAMIVVSHGTNAAAARPDAAAVYWIGSVGPNNAEEGDLWLD